MLEVRANSDRSRRFAFDQVPQHYDRGRARFPAPVVDVLIDRAQLRARARVLEVGAGTGQLTVPLAQRGLDVVALEPGQHLAAKLQRHVAAEGVAEVTVVCEQFEKFDSPDPFDAVVAANSFHWIAPHVGYDHAADLLVDVAGWGCCGTFRCSPTRPRSDDSTSGCSSSHSRICGEIPTIT